MGTLDDEFEAPVEADSDGHGYRIGGVRYVRPVQIGQSFATTQDDGHDQEDFFVTRTQNLISIDPSAEGAAAMRSSRNIAASPKMTNDF